jgi:ubiquinone/menaquinone biosynthesis C-methylase UbiE
MTTAPRIFQPGAQSDDDLERVLSLLDMQDTAPSIRRLRDWAFAAAQPRPGETAVDVGSGTGTVTRALAERVGPTGRVVGIEPNARLREVARTRAAGSSAEFADGMAASLPMADGSVDLLWCERVLQHVAEPQAAVDEFARVLRPGGRAVVLDSDHASRVTSTLDTELAAKFSTAFMAKVVNPRAAMRLPEQAQRAGLTVDPDIGSSALILSSSMLLRSEFVAENAREAVELGLVSQDVADEAVRALRAAAEGGRALGAVTVFGFVLRRPVTGG